MLRYLLVVLLSVQVAAAPVTVRWVNPVAWSDGSPLAQQQIRFASLYCADWRLTVPVTGPAATFDVAEAAQCRLTIIATKTDATAYAESDPSATFAVRLSALSAPSTITIEFPAPSLCTTRCTVKP